MKLVNLHGLQNALQGQKRLIGLDVGVKYLGVAVSDPDCRIAIPLSVLTLTQSSFMKNMEELQSLAKYYNVAGFVIGYPLNISGLRSMQAVKVDDFVATLQKTKKFEGLLYFWEDERFTSQVVGSVLKDYNLAAHKLKPIIDKFSAVNILQACLDRFSRLAH
eukprot:c22968_g1_i1 orf=576-1061(-)